MTHQLEAVSFGIEPAHVEKAEIGVAATASAEDPRADRQPFDVIERQFPHRVR
jgi:hypothetical protein